MEKKEWGKKKEHESAATSSKNGGVS